MKQQKRHQTNLISAITLIITGGIIVFLAIALYNHARLEVRFDTLINYLKQIDNSVAKLDSDVEIIICIFALYIAKCQLPIPMGFLCVISGMVFPLSEAIAINIIFTDENEYAKELFRALRTIEKSGAEVIIAQIPSKDGIGPALYDRLIRASGI